MSKSETLALSLSRRAVLAAGGMMGTIHVT